MIYPYFSELIIWTIYVNFIYEKHPFNGILLGKPQQISFLMAVSLRKGGGKGRAIK